MEKVCIFTCESGMSFNTRLSACMHSYQTATGKSQKRWEQAALTGQCRLFPSLLVLIFNILLKIYHGSKHST